jgi:tetratricopeptide (TPR) repeat protein
MLKKYLTYFIFLFLGLLSFNAQESLNTLIYKGNRSFDKKNYDNASSMFFDAVKKKNDDFGAHYNLANTLYKKKMYDQAASEYQKAQKLTKNSDEKAASLYNLGNTYLQNGNTDKAINSYKSALKLDADNKAILKNLQIAMKKKDQKRQNQQQNNQNQQNQNNKNQNNQDQKNKDGDNKNKDEKNNNSKNQENGNQGNQNKGNGNQGKLPNQQEKNNQQNQGNKIPKDVQKLILERSANQEKETARKLLNKDAFSLPESNEKDW